MDKITVVHLLTVPLENDYKHTIYFKNKTAQQVYFYNKIKHSFSDFSYQRKDDVIRIPESYDTVMNCNYVMYKNPEYNNKLFFAFITDIKYVQPDRTDVYIETDVIQTWMFDIEIKQSFVEREHVKDDNIGANTYPEQLETGDYVVDNKVIYQKLVYRGYVLGATTDLTKFDNIESSDRFTHIRGEIYNGIYSGVRYFYFNDTATIGNVLVSAANDGKSDTIVSIFMVPKEFIQHDESGKILASFGPNTQLWSTSAGSDVVQTPIYKPTSINGYIPKNNKLFTYPYCYILMSNNSGGGATYKYELFNDVNNLCDFYINFALTPGCSIRLIPKKYNGIESNNEEGLNGGKFPSCSWTTDVYTNWLTQNAINYPVKIASGAVSAITGAVSGAASGAVVGSAAGPVGTVAGAVGGGLSGAAGGVLSIASTIGEKYQHSLQPPQAEGNLNSGDVTFANGDLTFTAYQMSIKAEYAKIIDDYFSMFGYKVNRVKVPNSNHRRDYWYTKTIDVDIDGEIPQKDMQIIKNAYNNGITFWTDPNSIGIYSSNPII